MIIPYWLIVLWTIFILLLGAVGHEADMARNYKDCGNARAWIWEIKK